ncbi:Alpha/Beta hydrolase protein [Dipodascopsis uninucleata]
MSCPGCFTAVLQSGKQAGKEEVMLERNVYIAGEDVADAKGVILILSDIFGWRMPNTRLLADAFAKKGFITYLPDTIPFELVPEHMWQVDLHKVSKWSLLRYLPSLLVFFYMGRPSVSNPMVANYVRQLKQKSDLPLFIVGYCWGGRYALTACTNESLVKDNLIAAAAAVHPSNISVPNDIKGIKVPVTVALGTEDDALPKVQMDKIEEIWKQEDVDYELKWYEGMGHGFSSRGDFNDPKIKAAMDDSFKQVLDFFSKYAKSS